MPIDSSTNEKVIILNKEDDCCPLENSSFVSLVNISLLNILFDNNYRSNYVTILHNIHKFSENPLFPIMTVLESHNHKKSIRNRVKDCRKYSQ